MKTKTVTLNSGYEMPINGLGTYSLHGENCIDSVKSALSRSYQREHRVIWLCVDGYGNGADQCP